MWFDCVFLNFEKINVDNMTYLDHFITKNCYPDLTKPHYYESIYSFNFEFVHGIRHWHLFPNTELLKFVSLLTDKTISGFRLNCLSKYSGGLFHRSESKKSDLVVPFSTEIRRQMDDLIRHVDKKVLEKRGYPPMPLEKYKFFQKVEFHFLLKRIILHPV